MKYAVVILFITFLSASGGNALVDTHSTLSQDTDWLQYHNGTPVWGCYQGTYRGVWFNLIDFMPGGLTYAAAEAEMWFYHSSTYPWDTGYVYIELWNGDAGGPTSMLDQTMQTAVHCAPVCVYYNPEISVDYDFWILENTELSAGGWPSIASDANQAAVAHSFYLDGVDWTPWEYNFFVSCLVFPGDAFDPMSWGSIKTVF
jgi:hypothetical protein